MGSTIAEHGYNKCKNYILHPSYGPRSLIDQIFILYYIIYILTTSLKQTISRLTLTS